VPRWGSFYTRFLAASRFGFCVYESRVLTRICWNPGTCQKHIYYVSTRETYGCTAHLSVARAGSSQSYSGRRVGYRTAEPATIFEQSLDQLQQFQPPPIPPKASMAAATAAAMLPRLFNTHHPPLSPVFRRSPRASTALGGPPAAQGAACPGERFRRRQRWVAADF
jgi:hypothetical protein